MTCPNIEDIISFALAPDKEEQAELAAHIYTCRYCQYELKLINEFVIGQCEFTGEEVEEVLHFLANHKKPENLWIKLEKLLNEFFQRIAANTEETEVPLIEIRPVQAYEDKLGIAAFFSSAEDGTSSILYSGDAFKIGFSADLPREDPDYWYAELTIPPGVTEDSKLVVLITDDRENAVESGTLILLGQALPICYGIAEISLSALRDNLKNTEVKLRRTDGKIIDGNLVIC